MSTSILNRHAYIRTTKAIYDKAHVISDSMDKMKVTFTTTDRRGQRAVKSNTIDKCDIVEMRLYQEV